MTYYHIYATYTKEGDETQYFGEDTNLNYEQVDELVKTVKKCSPFLIKGKRINPKLLTSLEIWKTEGIAIGSKNWSWVRSCGVNVTKDFIIALPTDDLNVVEKEKETSRMSNNQQVLSLALETLSEIFKDSSSTASILRRCHTISILLGKEKEKAWIETELNGYNVNITLGELQKIAPDYRKVRLTYKDKYGRQIVFPDKLSIFQDDVVTQSIGEIEVSIKNGITILSGGPLDIVREIGNKHGFHVGTAHIESLFLMRIVEQVRNKALVFVNEVIREQSHPEVSGKSQEELGTIILDQKTENARLLLYTLENKLRKFVASKIQENNGKVSEDFIRGWQSAKRKEFLPPRKPLECELINYSSFDQLKRIIVQNENWDKIFKKYFGRQDGVISRINELDDIRDTIAHNRIISSFDYTSLKTLHSQLLGCIEK